MSRRGFAGHARGALAFIVLVVAASCGTPTSTTHVWKAEGVVRGPMTRVIVFGGGMTETGRRAMEDGFAAALAERGVAAKPSYELFPVLPEKERASAAVQAAGFDGALVSTLRGVSEKTRYVPGSSYGYGGFWGGYYGSGMGVTSSPGYVVNDELVNVESTLWDLRAEGGVLVWSATTETTNPSSTRDAVKSLTKELVPKLAEGGLIPKK